MLHAAFRNTVLEQKVEDMAKRFAEVFATPFTRDFMWAGIYGETEGDLPGIGPHQDFLNNCCALGYSRSGTTHSLLADEIIHDALTGKQHQYTHTFCFD